MQSGQLHPDNPDEECVGHEVSDVIPHARAGLLTLNCTTGTRGDSASSECSCCWKFDTKNATSSWRNQRRNNARVAVKQNCNKARLRSKCQS